MIRYEMEETLATFAMANILHDLAGILENPSMRACVLEITFQGFSSIFSSIQDMLLQQEVMRFHAEAWTNYKGKPH